MSEIDHEYLSHQYLYVPWVEGLDSVSVGKALGLYVAQQHKARLTIVTVQKSNANFHPEFNKLSVVTERSGSVQDGGVVLAWCPTYKVMEKVHHLTKSIVVLVEWPTTQFEGWAKLVGAYNIVTGAVMESGLSEAGTKALEGIVWEGYNGWHDDIARRLTLKRLQELAAGDGYDRELVLAYARREKSDYAIENLVKILNTFDTSLTATK
ncbi:MAG TPA: hypothetical protein VHX87_07010 [Galbitalea sp.]|jgi:hypothetical protein|nr:hypothetical protein [Galbitalea sp.]